MCTSFTDASFTDGSKGKDLSYSGLLSALWKWFAMLNCIREANKNAQKMVLPWTSASSATERETALSMLAVGTFLSTLSLPNPCFRGTQGNFFQVFGMPSTGL